MPIEKLSTRSISSQSKTITTPSSNINMIMFSIQQIFIKKKKSSLP